MGPGGSYKRPPPDPWPSKRKSSELSIPCQRGRLAASLVSYCAMFPLRRDFLVSVEEDPREPLSGTSDGAWPGAVRDGPAAPAGRVPGPAVPARRRTGPLPAVSWQCLGQPASRCGRRSRQRRPSMSTWPSSGRMKPHKTFSSVVLPAPFGPMTPTTWRGGTVSDTALSAVRPPKRTLTSRTSRTEPWFSTQVPASLGRNT
jgi:hypothetical protein